MRLFMIHFAILSLITVLVGQSQGVAQSNTSLRMVTSIAKPVPEPVKIDCTEMTKKLHTLSKNPPAAGSKVSYLDKITLTFPGVGGNVGVERTCYQLVN